MGTRDWDEETQLADEKVERPLGERDRAYLIVLQGANVGEMYKIAKGSVAIGRSQDADIRILDEGISRLHCTIRSDGDALLIEDHGSRNGTFANGGRITTHQLKDGDKIQVGSTTILKFTYHDDWDEDFQRQMYESALLDALTKSFNKRYFLDRLESEFRFARRQNIPLSLVMFDIDHFKVINDSYGHLAGDYVLSDLALCVQEQIRVEDVLARYGGEEFAVICRSTSALAAGRMAERIRDAVARRPFQFEHKPISVTVSVGVAGLPDTDAQDPMALVSAADIALYQAKSQGRNRVIVSPPQPLVP